MGFYSPHSPRPTACRKQIEYSPEMQTYSYDIFHYNKRRRSAVEQIRNETWGKQFWSGEEEAMNVKGVWDATLGILADAAVLVSQQENEEGESGDFDIRKELGSFERRTAPKRIRHQHASPETAMLARREKVKADPVKVRLDDSRPALPIDRGQHVSGSLMGPGNHPRLNDDKHSGIPLPLAGLGPSASGGPPPLTRQDNISLGRLSKLAGPDFKRCASHVHIAKFIEHQTNRKLLLPTSQARSMAHGFAQPNGDVDRDLAGRMLGGNGNFMKSAAPSMPETTANLMPPQDGPSIAMSNPYLNQPQFPPTLHAPNMPQLPPAYAHLLANPQQPPFPFMNQGLQFGISNAQLQAALTGGQSAGGIPPAALNPQMFAPNYPNLTGTLLSHPGPPLGPPPGGANPLPPLATPRSQGQGSSDAPGRAGSVSLNGSLAGNGMIPNDESAAVAYSMGLPNGTFNPQDLDKLRNAFTSNFLDARNPTLSSQAMLEGLRRNGLHDGSQLDQWNLSQINGGKG